MLTMCCRCGITKECEYIQDPYVMELYPEDNPSYEWWCDRCANDRRDDI